jgi:hypothetical protein
MARSLKVEGTDFNIDIVNEFKTEKEFINSALFACVYENFTPEIRAKLMSKVYKLCQKKKDK